MSMNHRQASENLVVILRGLTVDKLRRLKLNRENCSHYDTLTPYIKIAIFVCSLAHDQFKLHEILRALIGAANKKPSLGKHILGGRNDDGVGWFCHRTSQPLKPNIKTLLDNDFQVRPLQLIL